MDERGSVLPVVGLLVALAAGVAVALGIIAQWAVDRAEAQAAADASALAGVVEGRSGAIDLARRNEAEMVAFSVLDGQVEVVVERNGTRAVAAAVVGGGVGRAGPNQTDP